MGRLVAMRMPLLHTTCALLKSEAHRVLARFDACAQVETRKLSTWAVDLKIHLLR